MTITTTTTTTTMMTGLPNQLTHFSGAIDVNVRSHRQTVIAMLQDGVGGGRYHVEEVAISRNAVSIEPLHKSVESFGFELGRGRGEGRGKDNYLEF